MSSKERKSLGYKNELRIVDSSDIIDVDLDTLEQRIASFENNTTIHPVISDDGNKIAYDDANKLYVRDLKSDKIIVELSFPDLFAHLLVRGFGIRIY